MKYLILGAGPAGLTLANMLMERGEDDFLVIEKEDSAGGLCRSRDVDGSPFDTGGGHFLDVRDPDVTKFVFGFLPEDEWDRYERDSRIDLYGDIIGSPIAKAREVHRVDRMEAWQSDIRRLHASLQPQDVRRGS